MVKTKKTAILTCMDPRLNPFLAQHKELQAGDAFIVRNAGAKVTADTIRSLAIVTAVMGIGEIIVLGHTDCKAAQLTAREIYHSMSAAGISGPALSEAKFRRWPAQGEVDNIIEGVKKLKASPYVPKSTEISGFIIDIVSGSLTRLV